VCDCVKNPKHGAMSRIVCGDGSPVSKTGACIEGFAEEPEWFIKVTT